MSPLCHLGSSKAYWVLVSILLKAWVCNGSLSHETSTFLRNDCAPSRLVSAYVNVFANKGEVTAYGDKNACPRVRRDLPGIVLLRASDDNPYFLGSQKRQTASRRIASIRIQILEEVVKRLSDPNIQYHNKRHTMLDVMDVLRELKAADKQSTSDVLEPYANVSVKTFELKAGKDLLFQAQSANNDQSKDALHRLRQARLVAVLRGGHPDRLYQRGLELGRMAGCGAIEVALDCPGAIEVLRELATALPPSCMIGAATVMREQEARAAARAGARFLTSPINPPGFIGWCASENVMPIPAGLTPSELYAIIESGAPAVKLFPACNYSPAGLKQLLAVGPFQSATVLVSGGVDLRDVSAWLDSGAAAVGIGAQLVGGDTRLRSPPLAGGAAGPEERAWEETGRRRAAELFAAVAARPLRERRHDDATY